MRRDVKVQFPGRVFVMGRNPLAGSAVLLRSSWEERGEEGAWRGRRLLRWVCTPRAALAQRINFNPFLPESSCRILLNLPSSTRVIHF